MPPKGSGKSAKAGSSSSSSASASSKKEKKEKISVSSISLGEEKKEKPERKLANAKIAVTAKGRVTTARSDYLAGVDLPPSDDEEDEEAVEAGSDDEDAAGGGRRGRGRGSGIVLPNLSAMQMSDKQMKKKEKKEQMIAEAQEAAKKEAVREDEDTAFSVVLGSRIADMDDADKEGGGTDAHAKDIKVENFSVSARGKELFKNASLTIVHGRRYGLVGPNGMGKSTVMKLLARRKLPVPRGIDVLLVEQEIVADDRSALEAVVAADEELMRLRKEEVRLRALVEKYAAMADDEGKEGAAGEGTKGGDEEKDEEEAGDAEGEAEEVERKGGRKGKMEKEGKGKKGKKGGKGGQEASSVAGVGEGSAKDAVVEEDETTAGEKLTEVYERMREIGAEAAEARASKILAGLGFTKQMQARSTKSFSGGWRMRISLARALYIQPTLLLLDEPTNHLDLRAVLWLEEYLMRWKKTLIVVSHDRDFLNSVSTDIIHLHDMKLFFYKGNFEAFESMYEQKRRENNKRFEVYEKQLKAAKGSGSKASQDKVREAAKKKEERQSGKGKKKGAASSGGGDDGDAPREAPTRWRDYTVEFHFPEPTELTPPLLQLRDVEFQYPGREDFGLKDIDVAVDMGTRVAIVGPNGAGKSTLLNLLAGDLQPTSGESRQSQRLRIGRYSQHFVDLLTMDETPVEYLLRLYPNQEGPSRQEAVRSRLGKFGLPSHNHLTPIVKLSGGQKARVVFTAISMAKPHILMLDEPTNHLDMQSIDALADALDEFSGGVVLVSHDSRLISRVCDDEEVSEIWVVDEGTCKRFPGSFEDYKQQLLKEIIAEVEE